MDRSFNRLPQPPYPFVPDPITADITPLVTALATGKAVAFVGAGASIPAGLPNWKEFLARCLTQAKESGGSDTSWERADAFLREGDLPTAAELLQRGLGTQIEKYVWDAFGHCARPSMVHHAVARLPFSLAITTNYDRLLETAYSCRPSVRTWRDPEAVFSAIRHRRFAVVKTHGDVGHGPSIVLTKTQYRDLMRLNEAFNHCLRTLLLLRTFLFVGFSLRDPDISSLMDEARLTFGEDFGPHYAILFDDEVDAQFEQFLLDAYSIHVLRVPARPVHESDSEHNPQVDDKTDPEIDSDTKPEAEDINADSIRKAKQKPRPQFANEMLRSY